jgi:hypothetical protein
MQMSVSMPGGAATDAAGGESGGTAGPHSEGRGASHACLSTGLLPKYLFFPFSKNYNS